MRRSTIRGAVAAMAVAFASPVLANDTVAKLSADPNNWAQQQGDYANTRFSKLDQINSKNVKDLKVAWQFSTGVLRGHEGSPLVIGNIMYVHSPFPNTIYALDLDNEQKILWSYEPKQDPSVVPVMCCDTVNRGLAYADNTIVLHQADTTVVALDAKTGKEKWKVVNGDPKKGETGTSAPFIVKDKVLVGISGAEFGVRGPSHGLQPQGRQAALASLLSRPRRGAADGSGKDHVARKAHRQRQLYQDVDR